jgi:hypothetical protein
MSDFEARVRLKKEGRARMNAFTFGEPVTNVCAGEANPFRHAYFVKTKGDNAQLTDRRGRFGNFGCEVIYAGHLPVDEAKRLFEPFWQAQFGESSVNGS